jgi:hypothetical protein
MFVVVKKKQKKKKNMLNFYCGRRTSMNVMRTSARKAKR